MKRENLVNLSVLRVGLFLSVLLLEVASRLLFATPPSIVIENRSDFLLREVISW